MQPPLTSSDVRILVEGRNCWRVVAARRAAFLIDGSAYYGAVASTIANARRSIFILGWDIHSRVRLLRNGERSHLPSELGRLIHDAISKRPELHVYILDWDFPIIFAHERESRGILSGGWRRHPRIHFEFDGHHPAGASHHQKVILIDDTVAFAGGMDIALERWDSPEHRPADPRRNDAGREYIPAHDVQIAVSGDAANALGELVRDRWRRLTGEWIDMPAATIDDPWPADLRPDIEDIQVAISRTDPAFNGRGNIREVENLHLDAIRAAHSAIYIENQYLTSKRVAGELGMRLGQRDGPEVIVVLPWKNQGWLEAHTIEVLRFRSIHRLREMDRFGRLRVCYPVVPGLGDAWINLHSKVLIVDDRLVRVGSSNLTNRSMTIDTECDISIEAAGDCRISAAITNLRNTLLGEHLGMSARDVAAQLRELGSLVRLIDAHAHSDRTLKQLDVHEAATYLLVDGAVVDPDRPLDSANFIEQFAPVETRQAANRSLVFGALVLLFLSCLAAAWQWTPLKEWIDVDRVSAIAPQLRDSQLAPAIIVGIYLVAALIAIPITVLIFATALIFGVWRGIAYSMLGSFVSGLFTYWLGKVIGARTVDQFGGRRMRAVIRRIRKRGLLTMIVVRLLPIGPFTVINMVIGASQIPLRDFAFGTLIGMLPGVVAISIFGSNLEQALREPGVENLVILAVLTLLLIISFLWIRRLVGSSGL